jgi:hypothetical protein
VTAAHRKRRIAADEAHSWARNLRLRNPYAKLVLGMLTLYVDHAGSCFVGIETLAEDTELSSDTVRKRLAWLEQIGAIARFPQWLDANGRRNGDGRGKRTSDEIRLLLDGDPDLIEAKALGDVAAETGDASPSHQQGLNREPGEASPAVALGQPSHCSEGLISEPEPEDSPQAPLRGVEPSPLAEQESEPDHTAPVEGWEEFKTAFEADAVPILRVSIAKGLFAALTPDERRLVTKAAHGLILHRRRERKPGAKPSAQTFIREIEAWPGWAKLAPADETPASFVPEGSREHRALRVLDLILDRASPQCRFDVARGCAGFLRKSPVTADDLIALAEFADKPTDQWCIVEERSQPFGAWCERIEKWMGKRPDARVILTGELYETTDAHGRPMTASRRKVGLRVPCVFPPRKDGTIATGPPQSSSAA